MFFFVFMLVCSLIVPSAMIVFGLILKNNPPAEINKYYGYRTALSSKNADTWIFANKYCGKIWVKIGTAAFLVSVIIMLFFTKSSEKVLGIVGSALSIAQCALLVLTIPIVERKLKQTFDSRGKRKT